MGYAAKIACALENCRSFFSTGGTRPADGTVDWVRREVFKTRIPKSDQYNIKMCIITKIHFLEKKLWSWQVSPYRTIRKCRRFGGNSCFQLQG